MTKKSLCVLVVLIAVLGMCVMTVDARVRPNDPRVQQADLLKSTALKVDADNAQTSKVSRQSSYAPVGIANPNVVDSRGKLLAQTYMDWQGHINAGNHVAINPSVPSTPLKAAVHFVYTARAQASTGINRWAYTAYDASNATVPLNKVIVQASGPSSIEAGRYPAIVIDPVGGKAIVSGEDQVDNADSTGIRVQTSWDSGPLLGSFGSITGGSIISDSLMFAGSWTNARDNQMMVKSAMKITASDTILYLATRDYWENPDNSIYDFAVKVYRKIGKHRPTTNPDPEWELVFIDTIYNCSQNIVVDPTSDRVALVWSKYGNGDRSAGTGNDVWYADSDDKGITWVRHNLTNITTTTEVIPWEINEALFDHEGKLHIIYTGTYNTDGATFNSILCKLMHWSEQDPTHLYTVYDATWSLGGVCGRTGYNVMNVGRLAIAECEDRLYVTFSSLDPVLDPTHAVDDCAKTATAFDIKGNAEIYLTVSKDLIGKGWDLPRNLSDSYTPNCDTGTCADDQHSALTPYGMDDADYAGTKNWTNAVTYDPGTYTGSKYLQLTYCTDRFPGRAQSIQGPWTLNDVRWIRLACTPPVVAARLICRPDSIKYPEYVKPGTPKSYTIKLENAGNLDLTFVSIDNVMDSTRGYGAGPTGWMTHAYSNTGIPEAGSDSLTLTLNAGGVITAGPTVLFGKLRFIYNTPLDTHDVKIEFTVADTIVNSTWDTLVTACTKLAVGTNGNMGHEYGDSAGYQVGQVNLDYYGNANECDTGTGGASRGDSRIYLGDGSPIVVRKAGTKYIGSWSVYGEGYDNPHGFKPVSGNGYAAHGSFTDPNGRYTGFNSGTFVTTDSLVKVEKTWYAPTMADSCNFIVQRMRFFPATIGSDVAGLQIGEVIDFDIASDSGTSSTLVANASGSYAASKLVWQRGLNKSDTVTDCADNSRRYAGLALLFWHTKTGVCYDSLWGAGTYVNGDVIGGAVVPDTMAKVLHATSYNISSNQGADLSTWMCFKDGTSGYTLKANDTLTVYTTVASVLTAASTNAGLDSLKTAVAKANYWAKKTLKFCGCCSGKRGNVNAQGIIDLSDLSALVSYLTGGGYVLTCEPAANVNGVGIVDLSDLSALVSYLTGGGYVLPDCP